ncbi:MAG: hypothetical protein GQ578_04185 [Desulfuromonadaceae bacterium]|nr:hypothetical protein [Desulfuromonadaceae bacterium]
MEKANVNTVDFATVRAVIERVIARKKGGNFELILDDMFASLPDDVKGSVTEYGDDTTTKDVIHKSSIFIDADLIRRKLILNLRFYTKLRGM